MILARDLDEKRSFIRSYTDIDILYLGDPVPEPRPACVGHPVDVAFILDGSGSVGKTNFEGSLMFLKMIVSRMGKDSRVATVQYSTAPELEFPFTSGDGFIDYTVYQLQIDNLGYPSHRGVYV